MIFEHQWREDLADLGPHALEKRAPVIALTNRRAYLRHRLLTHLLNGAPTMAVEGVCGELLIGATDEAGYARPLYRRAQLSWYAKRVDQARELFDHEYCSDQSLYTVDTSFTIPRSCENVTFNEMRAVTLLTSHA